MGGRPMKLGGKPGNFGIFGGGGRLPAISCSNLVIKSFENKS